MYDGSGQCIEQPAEPEPFCGRIKIKSYPTEEYIGLIFLYLGEGEPPPMYRFPQLDDGKYLQLNRFPIWPCSFWNRQENDPVHVAFVHREGPHGDIGLVQPPRVWAEETAYGMAVHEKTPDGIESTGHRLMPAMTQFIAPDGSQNVGWKVPIDDTHTIHPVVRAIPLEKLEAYRARQGNQRPNQADPLEIGEAVLRGEVDLHDPALREITNIVNVQDYASMVAQGAIPDFEHEHLGQSDNSLIFWRKLWARELRNLAEGRPLKAWTQSIHLTSERHFTDRIRGEVPTTTGLGVLGGR
jgi:5,5'-dehydrodivanillate O-demethylase